MPKLYLFELVSPERLLFSGEVDMVTVPGSEGDFGAMADHSPLISLLRPGEIHVHQGGRITRRMRVTGGFAEVTAQRCTVLADSAAIVADGGAGSPVIPETPGPSTR